MANVDNPRGFWPVSHLTGGEIRTRSYTCTTSAVIYRGDPLKVVAGGTVEVAAANDGEIVIGVAAEYVNTASAGQKIQVYDDPFIIFGVQSDSGTATTSADVFAQANFITYAAGSSTTGQSIMELDASDITTGGQLKIVGLVDSPDNAWGEHSDLLVVFNEHFYHYPVAGV